MRKPLAPPHGKLGLGVVGHGYHELDGGDVEGAELLQEGRGALEGHPWGAPDYCCCCCT